jgi:tetratricopeptide (TPR) repeat protein
MRGTAWRRPLAALLLLILTLPAAAQNGDRMEPFQPLPSTALVLAPLKAGFLIQGSAVVIDRNERLMLTNHHVSALGQPLDAIFPIWADDGQVLISRDLYLKRGQRIPGKCVAVANLRDLALIQLDSLPATVGAVKLAEKSPKLEERVHLLGNPGNNKQVWVYGAGKVQFVGDEAPELEGGFKLRARVIKLTTDDRKMSTGASGGPAVNDRGELVGVMQSGTIQAGDKGASSVRCLDIAEVRQFVGEYHRKLGSAALARQEYTEAVTRCTKAVEVNPGDALAFHERGAARSFQHHYDEAVADYSAALKLNPTLPKSWRGRAAVYIIQGKFDKAVADCTEAVRLDPRYALAYLSRSRAFEKLGKADEARADRDRAVKLDPSLK